MGQAAGADDGGLAGMCCAPEESNPLHAAARSNDMASMKRLLRSRASPHTWDISGSCPAHLAAESGNLETLRLLLACHCDVDIRDVSGERPAHRAAEAGCADAISVLILFRANLEATDIDGRTAVHCAAAAGTLTGSLLRLLVEGGANMQATTRHGETPVDLAAANGHKRVVRWLRGATLGLRIAEGEDGEAGPDLQLDIVDLNAVARIALDVAEAETISRGISPEVIPGDNTGDAYAQELFQPETICFENPVIVHKERKEPGRQCVLINEAA